MTTTDKKSRRALIMERMNKTAECDATKTSRESHLILPAGVDEFTVKSVESRNVNIIPFINTVVNKTCEPKIHVYEDNNESDVDFNSNHTYYRPFIRHTFDMKNYACLRTIGEKCPMCDEYDRLAKELGGPKAKYEKNKHIINVFKPTQRVLYNILEDDKVFVWDASSAHVEALLRKEVQEDKEKNGTFHFLADGVSLRIRFGATDFSTSYFKPERIDFFDREDIDPSVLDRVADLNEILDFKTYDELLSIMNDAKEQDDKSNEEKEEEYKAPEQSMARTKEAETVEEPVGTAEDAPEETPVENADDLGW